MLNRKIRMLYILLGIILLVISNGIKATAQVNEGEAEKTSAALRTKIRGIDEADYSKIFLDAADLPVGMKLIQDSKSGESDPKDKNFAKFKGKRDGFIVWMADREDAPIWRIVDIRIVFPDAESAKNYLNSSAAYLSEGLPEIKTISKIGEECRLFGGESKMSQQLGISMPMYAYVFRTNNVVVKFFVAQGMDSKTPIKPAEIALFAKKIVNRINK